MKNRVDVKNFILQIEQDFPVNNWKINDIHLWPILRIRLFFYLINKLENTKKNSNLQKRTNFKAGFFQKIIRLIEKKLTQYKDTVHYFFWHFKLPERENIFLGSDSHRVDYKNSRFNRYFDVLIEKEQLHGNSLYFEYGSDLKNQYNKDLIFKYDKPLKGYLSLKGTYKKINTSLDGYTNFLDYLSKQELFHEFVKQNKQESIVYWFKKYFGLKILFFLKVLKKINPQKIVILCYYSDTIYALLVAANRLGIETIEMQHGPQTDIHLSYGSWTCVPNEGYDVLPRNFWCWDNYSKEVLEKWISKNKKYAVKVVGHPWVEYWKNNEKEYFEKDFILYSLQPNPITLEQLFTPTILQLIKETDIKWFIRLHPRQLKELDSIKSFLKEKNVLHNVNIDNATYDALPILLSNAKKHITHSSGSALEASYYGLKTILINEIGLKSFPHLIDTKMAIFIDYKEDSFYIKMKMELTNEE